MGIDRKDFLSICQKVSMLNSGVCGTKQNVPDELKVKCNGIVYYPLAYKLSFNNGQPVHTAILHDLHANSTTEANLQRVER